MNDPLHAHLDKPITAGMRAEFRLTLAALVRVPRRQPGDELAATDRSAGGGRGLNVFSKTTASKAFR